ncbi:MAG: hypothetical protein Fur0044_17610 [Anaerolineae bacterium]
MRASTGSPVLYQLRWQEVVEKRGGSNSATAICWAAFGPEQNATTLAFTPIYVLKPTLTPPMGSLCLSLAFRFRREAHLTREHWFSSAVPLF